MTLAVQGATVLTPQGWAEAATVLIRSGRFEVIGAASAPPGCQTLNATGLHLLPGLVDLHGDAFERMICPRPGVRFPLETALLDNDRALLAAGITTFYYSITDSFEPELRSRATACDIIQAVLSDLKPYLQVNSAIHIRHEQSNTEHIDELYHWLETDRVQLLSLNDHVPPDLNDETLQRYTKGLRQRIKRSETEIRALIEAAYARRPLGRQQTEKLAVLAQAQGIPLASHDDETPAEVADSLARGVAIAEFPATIALAQTHRAQGVSVLMGAPNLLRGGSHVGYMGVAEAVPAEAVDCLCSDYHYASLLNAPFKLQELGLMSLDAAWALVSANPAKAAGIDHRVGAIAPGLDANFLLMDLSQPPMAGLKAVYSQGRPVAQF
ncbi:MAG: alpha-D-ribose 1-methylphosphonate 5-triphosphate diphosphatase [Cyanobacteria bacterium J06632_22]